MKRFLVVVFLLFSSFVHVNAQKIAVLTDSLEEFIFHGEYLEILEDPEKNFSINDIISGSLDNKFVLNKDYYTFNKNPQSAYWVRFRIKNRSSADKSFIFESYSLHTKSLQLYIPKNGEYYLKEAGQKFNFFEREYIHKNLVFDIPLRNNDVKTYYVRIESPDTHSGFDFRIKSNNYFSFYSTHEYYFLGMFYGILLIMAIYNLLVFLTVRERVYLYYVLYVVSGILVTLTDDGLGYQFLWSSHPQWNSFIGQELAPNLLILTFVLYSVNFLELKSKYPNLLKFISYSVYVYVAYYILKSTVLPDVLHTHIFYLFPFIAIFVIALYCLKKGYRPARYYVLGYTFIFISIVIIQLRASGSVEGNLFTVYSFNYGIVFEIVVFSFALAERIKFIKKEKEKAQIMIIDQLKENKLLQEKVNRELEQKVEERTEELRKKNLELEDTNIKLQEMTEKANLMSQKLDKDNWNLQRNIKDSIKARMNDEEVTYEEFKQIFPDELSCYRFLDEVKWKDKYECRKCGNSKFIEGPKRFSRKCTRCGYPESVTAYTLFHGLRFPVDKAFYLTYLVHKKQNKITLDELSDLLELRRNTCWSFKKKILATLGDGKKKKREVDSWEDLILEE